MDQSGNGGDQVKGKLRYRSVNQLSTLISQNLGRLPHDIDAVVGIPRSGMLVASMIGLQLGVPVTTVDSVCEQRPLEGGIRLQMKDKTMRVFLATPRRLLVVDDSCGTGYTMKRARDKLKASPVPHRYTFLAPYVNETGMLYVDQWFEQLPKPRVFEWNWTTHAFLLNACVDIDGVLCRDPRGKEYDEPTTGENYGKFLLNVPLLRRLRGPIKALVTCRMEKRRPETVKWLKRHGVKYKKLIMMQVNSVAERRRVGHANYKASWYKKLGGSAFVESSYKQAVQIRKLTKMPVLSVETMEFFG